MGKVKTPKKPKNPEAGISKKLKTSKKRKTSGPKSQAAIFAKTIRVSEKKLQRFMDKAQKEYAEHGESPKLAKLVTLTQMTEKAIAKWKQYKTRRDMYRIHYPMS